MDGASQPTSGWFPTADQSIHVDQDAESSQNPPSGPDMGMDEDPQPDSETAMVIDAQPSADHPGGSTSEASTSQMLLPTEHGGPSSLSTPSSNGNNVSVVSHGPISLAGSGSSVGGRTVTVPMVDEKAQSELRRKIMDIQRDPTISFADKAGMIQVHITSPLIANANMAQLTRGIASDSLWWRGEERERESHPRQ